MERKNIFRGKNKKNGWIYGDLIHNRGELKIVGNVYDNVELLNK